MHSRIKSLTSRVKSKPPGQKRSTVYFFGQISLKPQAKLSSPEQCRVKIAPVDKTEPGIRNLSGEGVWPKLGKFMDRKGGVSQTE